MWYQWPPSKVHILSYWTRWWNHKLYRNSADGTFTRARHRVLSSWQNRQQRTYTLHKIIYGILSWMTPRVNLVIANHVHKYPIRWDHLYLLEQLNFEKLSTIVFLLDQDTQHREPVRCHGGWNWYWTNKIQSLKWHLLGSFSIHFVSRPTWRGIFTVGQHTPGSPARFSARTSTTVGATKGEPQQ